MAKKKKRKTGKAKTRKVLDASLPIFQLKIELADIEPPIWRRIETHDCSLADLHEIIQTCMGWDDEHMYAFEIEDEQYTDLGREADPYEYHDSRPVRLSQLVESGHCDFVYEYDFGDSWRHNIEIEKTLPAEEGLRYPRCTDGGRAGPPEDCGGPYGYLDFLDALQNPDNEEHEETLEWAGDFDPEKFIVEAVNDELGHLRRWIGRRPAPGAAARFAKGDRVRLKQGTVHSEYPDIPLGGWGGTVARVAWLVPISYKIRWSEATLAAAHPIYLKRCQRDDADPKVYFADEVDLEAESAEGPAEMEQPTNLVTRPLSADDQEDRIRMVFGLTSDDRLPVRDVETEQQYMDWLKAHLTFPFSAVAELEVEEYSLASKHLTVFGFAAAPTSDVLNGLLCEARCGHEPLQVPLAYLDLDESDPNFLCVSDYAYWLNNQDIAIDEEYCGDEEGDEYWDDEQDYDEEDYDEEDEEDEDRHEHEDAGEGDEYDGGYDAEELLEPPSLPQPFRREQPPVGRNDPCPCGSGKKFKKCCLGKLSQHDAEVASKFPIGTIALYGPDDKRTTKIAASVIKREGAEPILERWVGTTVKENPKVQREITAFFKKHGVKSVVVSDGNMGCPHEEGEDFPLGGDCPFCPFWQGKQGSGATE